MQSNESFAAAGGVGESDWLFDCEVVDELFVWPEPVWLEIDWVPTRLYCLG